METKAGGRGAGLFFEHEAGYGNLLHLYTGPAD